MNPAAPGTTIGRLRVAPGRAAALRRALELADWPEPDDGAIVLVRRIALRTATGSDAPGSADPHALASAATRAVAAGLRAAVAADAPGAADAPAVRFASAAALYAQLACDLVAGRAARCWYWARWRRLHALPAALALAGLWSERPLALGAIAAELARSGALATLWPHLSPAAAAGLTQALAAASGWPAPALAAPTRGAHSMDSAAAPAAPAPALPPELAARWRPACRGLAADDARVRLALFVLLLDWRPALLADGGVCTRLAQALVQPPAAGPAAPRPAMPADAPAQRAALGGAADARAHGADAPASAAGDPRRRAALVPPSPAAPAPAALRVHVASGGLPAAQASRRPAQPLAPAAPTPLPTDAAVPAGPAATMTQTGRLRAGAGADAAAGTPRTDDPDSGARIGPSAADDGAPTDAGPDPAADAGVEVVETAFGGLPYLFNVLNHPRVQALAGGARGLDARGGGWHAWLALGRALGLDPDDELARHAERRWRRHAGSEAAWTPRADDAPLVALAAALCGPALWTPALIAGPGRLRANATHLDFERPLASVRLAVRRAGLDLDPGWLPWLGRVVAIHYRERWP